MVLWCGVCCGTVCLWSLWGDRIGMFGQKAGIWNVFDPSTWQAPPSRTRLRDLMKQYACIAARVHALHAVASLPSSSDAAMVHSKGALPRRQSVAESMLSHLQTLSGATPGSSMVPARAARRRSSFGVTRASIGRRRGSTTTTNTMMEKRKLAEAAAVAALHTDFDVAYGSTDNKQGRHHEAHGKPQWG